MHKIEYNMLHLKHMIEAKTGRQYSLTKIADDAGIHRNTIQRMAKNKTARIDLEVIAKLMTLYSTVGLDITPNDFFVVITNNVTVGESASVKKMPSSTALFVNDLGITAQSDPGEPKNSL